LQELSYIFFAGKATSRGLRLNNYFLINKGKPLCRAYYLGTIDYTESLSLQKRLSEARKESRVGDILLLLQHFPVFTIGPRGDKGNILASKRILKRENISVIKTDRGGDITYHGPGQLVGYPIFDLRNHGKDIRQYVRCIESVIISALSGFSIEAQRVPGFPGVWVGEKKIAALGIRISRWITTHGFSLNVNNDLKVYNYIVPCGIRDRGVTSMSEILGHSPDIQKVMDSVIVSLGRVFGMDVETDSPKKLEVKEWLENTQNS
jgi:lipoyl(octanoyl) transferase